MTILSAILGVETGGGHNITQGLGTRDINNNYGRGGGDPAQGYFQITNATWAQFGGGGTGYSSAIAAPPATQLQIAQNIPVSRWGPASQSALLAAGYTPQPGETLGQMMTRYGETPGQTVAADGSTFTGSGSTIASGPVDNSQGSLPASDPTGTSVTQNPAGTGTTTAPAAQGAPVQQALQPEAVSQISSWILSIESAFGGGLKSVITAAETSAATWLGSTQNWFIRAGLIFLGVLVIIAALVILMWDHGGQQVAQQASRVIAA